MVTSNPQIGTGEGRPLEAIRRPALPASGAADEAWRRGRAASRRAAAVLDGNGRTAARALGWFSVGLGLTELVAPHSLGGAIGVRRPWTLRALGVREIASGVGLLAQPQRPMWLWTRLAGDAMDLTLLGMAFGTHRSHRGRLATATGAVGLVTALDLICTRRTSQLAHGPAEPVQLAATIVIERSREELYRFWRDLTQLPRFMRSIREVRIIDQRHSRWFAAGSDGESLSWESEITEDRPGEYIAWRSTPGSRLDTEGVVRFEPAPNGEGSLVRLQVSYRAAANAGSALGKLIATLARSEIKSELRRFKQLIETGEVATTDGQPSGRRSGLAKLLHRVRS